MRAMVGTELGRWLMLTAAQMQPPLSVAPPVPPAATGPFGEEVLFRDVYQTLRDGSQPQLSKMLRDRGTVAAQPSHPPKQPLSNEFLTEVSVEN